MLLLLKAWLNIRGESHHAELFLQTFFHHTGESNLSGSYPSANENLTVTKRKGTVAASVSPISHLRLRQGRGDSHPLYRTCVSQGSTGSLKLRGHSAKLHAQPCTCFCTWEQHVPPLLLSDSPGNQITSYMLGKCGLEPLIVYNSSIIIPKGGWVILGTSKHELWKTASQLFKKIRLLLVSYHSQRSGWRNITLKKAILLFCIQETMTQFSKTSTIQDRQTSPHLIRPELSLPYVCKGPTGLGGEAVNL